MLMPMLRTDFFDDMSDLFMKPFGTLEKFNFNDFPIRTMKSDIHEYDDNYTIDIELPGFTKEEIEVELKEGILIVSANKSTEKEEKDDKGKVIRKERSSGSVSRSYNVAEGDIKASFENGLLKLVIAKKEPVEPKKNLISIED